MIFLNLVLSLYMLILKLETINLCGFEVVAISKLNAASIQIYAFLVFECLGSFHVIHSFGVI